MRLHFRNNIINTMTIVSLFVYTYSAIAKGETLTLQSTILHAQNNDVWLSKSNQVESSLKRLSEGARTIPDPTFSIGMLNLPTDGFALDQEPMTQIKIGASQMFPRGDSLVLQEKKYQLAASEQPFLRDNRRMLIERQATQLWLEAYKASASYQLIDESRPLFDKLNDIVSASYASSLGKADQQEIIRTELELVRLNDRLINLESLKHAALAKLTQYVFTSDKYSKSINLQSIKLPQSLPTLTENQIKQLNDILKVSSELFHTLVAGHPLIAASEQRILVSAVDIDIAEQGFKPQYGVNTSYALRDDTPSGQSRADFFSIGLSINVPIFSNRRQDANIDSAMSMTEVMRTDKLLIIRDLMAGLKEALATYQGANRRLDLYERQILPKMAQQTQAALQAYTIDSGDFAAVVRAQIDELDARLTALNIRVDQRLALANLQYFYSPSHTMQTAKHSGGNVHE